MSRAGKFIPGGGNKGGDGAAGRTGPIRAPAPGAPVGEAAPGKKGTALKGASLIKPVAKNQRVPIMVMSSVVCCLLVSFAWYEFAVVPAKNAALTAQQQAAVIQKKLDDAQAEQAKKDAEQKAAVAAARATLTVDSKPTGAMATIGGSQKTTPASFTDLPVGKITLVIHADGYEDYHQDMAVTADKPTDMGTIELSQMTGSLALSSPQTEVEYSLTGPGDYSHNGQMPDKLDKLPVGDYQLTVSQRDWKLAPMTVTIHDQENVQKDVKFPYATAIITSTPPGATVRKGNVILGQTPLTLSQLRPADLKLSVDLAPYLTQRFVLSVPESGNVSKQVTLQQDKSFIAACGMPMVWIPEGKFWAGKYLVRQSDFETVASYNPSTFRRPDRPVETISWEAAMVFCEKLNQYESKAGKLPAGYHYTLPMESQWEAFSADADIDEAAMSRASTLSSTQDVGASEPNKYGIFDSLGNVWEWCLDAFDDKGDHSLRGGNWLSSPENFPGPDTRQAGPAKYADRFTGFRVVLVPQ